ncbi:hypothetical protein [Archangium lansingense]|uniref:IPT/TIG domain-containing protein n=1 Tax=Archangium lansingense TaxID=2995310 RepID=A0ABT4AIT4_9BACT|nr:hypothetical protein [Archangium lansinium]MCY1081600.1 hypothetical protein [Archangium lansinium]
MRFPVAAALLTLVACSRTIEGPTPTVSGATNPRQPGLQPARVCNAQGGTTGWRVSLAGSGFAPVPQDVLTDSPRVGLPEVTLRGPSTATLPRERVFFVSANQLDLDVPTRDTSPAQELAPGNYTVEVKNPSGTTGQLADALLVVPPPTLTSATAPEGFTQTAPSPVELVGTGFRTGEVPTAVIRGTGLPEVTLTDVAVVSATRVTANVPPNTPAGTYDMVLTNPEGCAFTLPQGLVISFARLGTLSIDPRFGWRRQNQSITIFNTPSNSEEQTFSGGLPEIVLFAPLKADPTKSVEIPLRRAAFVNGNTVTAVVPTCSGNAALPLTDPECPNGIVPGGPYAVRVKDPSSATGSVSAENGFTVLEDPVPAIASIAPSAITTNGLTDAANPLVVTGSNFGANAKVQLLIKPIGSQNVRACDLTATGTPSGTELRALVTNVAADKCVEYTPIGTQVAATGGFSLSEGLYVVRVQNTANPAYVNYSGLIVTNPSANPTNEASKVAPLTTKLTGPRASFPLVVATDDLGQPYLYALGGTNGTTPLASVEAAPVTLFGELGGQCTGSTCTFRTLERSPLGAGAAPEPRHGHTAVVRTVPGDTSYLVVLGGIRADGTTMNTVERAQVLKVADAPALLPPTPGTGGSLSAGTFYYRVSALRAADDPKNPGGETLPSDEYPATIDAAGGGSTTLAWPCIPGAASYRVYRTVGANAVSGSELLLDEVPAAACTGSPLPEVSYTDNGSKTPAGDAPLPPGALGKWVSAGPLYQGRGNTAARLVDDTVYVVGGFCSPVGTRCPSTGANLSGIEIATFAANTADLSPFGLVGNLSRARQRHSLAVASSVTAPNAFTPTAPDNSQDAWLLVVGGDAGGAPLTGTGIIETAQVKSAGWPSPAPILFTQATYNGTASTHGGWTEVMANYLFHAGATGGTGFAFRSNLVCGKTGTEPAKCTSDTSFDGTLNATSVSYLSGGPRYLSGNVLFRAFVYAAGGFPNDAGGTPTDTVERLVY